ncbi:peptidoglycan-binding protein [Vibrio spartinae]|uniref:Chitinase n=1 Tax=Vibrio spartinae TaxID=1918945 RepID=A0A1N6M840_9VIBR|nr:peptidoglycan-binding protein [Vibrio spartinae]QMV14195.1 putative chitinase [Vibrio spartinae]SIO95584.1 Putative peptidoglycan binding domain protein [Vibrio spartinae]
MSSIALKEILTNKEYTFKENINLDNNTSVMASFQLQDKNGKLLGKEIPKNLKIKDKKVSTKVKVEDLAKQNKVSVKDIYKLMASIDVDNDKVFQKNEKTTVEVIPMVLQSDLLKDSETLNKLAVKRSKGYKKGIKGNEEVKLIQKALIELNFDLGNAGADGYFGNGTKGVIAQFQAAYTPTHATHKVYDFGDIDGIVGKDTILALDEALCDEWTSEIKCSCNRDFSVEDIKKLVAAIRSNTYYDGERILFFHKNKLFNYYANVPDEDRTHEKLTKVLNDSFNKYGISKCIHKIHYLANMYVETMYFTATREGKGISDYRYDPYRGRGFQHLTWKENYENYKEEQCVDIVTNYEWVADKLDIAADTGAWYWDKKSINDYAEKDSIFDTARLINIPGAKKSSQINGYDNRESAWKALKNIFKYPSKCSSGGA